jgi:DNA topoisomerase-2
VQYKKQNLEFFTEHEFEEWRNKHPGEKYEYAFLKGLGSSTTAMFKNYMKNIDQYLVQFEYKDDQDGETLDLCFLKDTGFSDKRKVWLDLE